VDDRISIRLKARLTGAELARLNREFRDLLAEGDLVQTTALPEEENEPELAALPRVVLAPFRRKFGRLRQLIDALNLAETEGVRSPDSG
jgi:hypothetical protein